MFLVRRVCKVERKDVWAVAKLLRLICNAYENDNRRNSAMIYITGAGTPAQDMSVCAEWTQETIEANRSPNVPAVVKKANLEMIPLLKSYEIEFHEVATDEKIAERT
jgi:hypothetical protein